MDTRAFFEAVKEGQVEQVRSILDGDPGLANARSENGFSPLTLATYYGRTEVANLLVERGAGVNIFEAAMTGRLERVQEILDQQPGLVNAVALDGFQPLGLASFFGHLPVAELLLASGAEVNAASHNEQGVPPLNSAAAGGHFEIARLLLESGADPNARQSSGFTPLHSAAQNGQLELVVLLLERGADPQARAEDGRTPLDFARQAGHSAVAGALQRQG